MAGRLLIVGAGLVGSLAAVYFARGGWRVTVMERRPDPRAKGYAGGVRSTWLSPPAGCGASQVSALTPMSSPTTPSPCPAG